MGRMRGELEREEQIAREEEHDPSNAAPNATASEISHLNAQIRTLQARIIASHVSRSSLERDISEKTDEAREYRTELGEAVRALKRARAETRKLDEERRKGVRLYEETRERLVPLMSVWVGLGC